MNDTHAKRVQFENERDYMISKWGHVLLRDPYYNPNLTLSSEDFALSRQPRDRSPRIINRDYRPHG